MSLQKKKIWVLPHFSLGNRKPRSLVINLNCFEATWVYTIWHQQRVSRIPPYTQPFLTQSERTGQDPRHLTPGENPCTVGILNWGNHTPFCPWAIQIDWSRNYLPAHEDLHTWIHQQWGPCCVPHFFSLPQVTHSLTNASWVLHCTWCIWRGEPEPITTTFPHTSHPKTEGSVLIPQMQVVWHACWSWQMLEAAEA